MQKLKFSGLVFLTLVLGSARAQQSDLVRAYISQYKEMALAEMQRTGVPASIKLAQGINETMAGTSDLVMRSNNHFGIKCKSTWTGETVKHNDDRKGECFRKYSNPMDSYRDHSDFLKGNDRYAFLFALDPTDYEGWAWGLKKAGYATNPRYALSLIKTIEDYGLQEYTLIAMGKMPADPGMNGNTEPAITNTTADNMVSPAGNGQAGNESTSKPDETIAIPQYPRGEFRINETRVIYAPKGSSWLAIAKEYDIDLSKIFEFNDLPKSEELDRDRLVFLQRKRKTGSNEFHMVKPGETLHDIAQQEAIRLESLLELNWLRQGDIPAIGEQLSLQKKSASVPRLALKTGYSLYPGTGRGTN